MVQTINLNYMEYPVEIKSVLLVSKTQINILELFLGLLTKKKDI